MSIGHMLKKLRKEKGLNQEGLADALGVDRPAISHWERGNVMPNSANLQKIADFFKVPMGSLFTEEESADLKEYNLGAAIKRMNAVSDVTLLAVAELLAKANNQPTAVVVDQLEGLVRKRLAEQE